MRAELGLPSVKGDDEHGGGMTGGFGGSMGGAGQGGKGKRPISVKFEIPYFTTSGIQVRYLKIIEPKVSAVAIRALLTICASSLAPLFTPPQCNWHCRWFCNRSPAVARNLHFFLILSGLWVARSMGCLVACHKGRNGAMARTSVRSVGSCLDSVLLCAAVTLTHLAR